jgi:hypothetical protein
MGCRTFFKHLKMPMRRHLTAEEASIAIGFLQTGLWERQVGAQFNGKNMVLNFFC